MKTLIAVIKNIPDEIDTDHLDVYVRSKLYRDDFINRIEIDVKDMPKKIEKINRYDVNVDYDFGIEKEKDGWNACIDELLGEEE